MGQGGSHRSGCNGANAGVEKVLITGAEGQVAYSLLPMIAQGTIFGDRRVLLHLLCLPPALGVTEAVKDELLDAGFTQLAGVLVTANILQACDGVSYAIMLGGFPRRPGMDRRDVMERNVQTFKEHGSALERAALPSCKVLVVANPANTNAIVLAEHAPSIPRMNITCLTRLDHNRAVGQLAFRTGLPASRIRNVAIWGNHSSTQYPDVSHAVVIQEDGSEIPVRDVVSDDAYLEGEFMQCVRRRGEEIIALRGVSSALSAAAATSDHMRDWVHGTAPGSFVSMGVITSEAKTAYGIPPGLCYSFPVVCRGGAWKIVQGLPIDARSRALMEASVSDLLEEKELACRCLGLAPTAGLLGGNRQSQQ